VLGARRVGIQVPLDAAEQLTQVIDPHGDDDAGVRAAGALPIDVEAEEIRVIERQDRSTMVRGVGKMVLIRDPLSGPTSFLAALRVKAAAPQQPRQIPKNVLVREEAGR
jgi:hypothetical protein